MRKSMSLEEFENPETPQGKYLRVKTQVKKPDSTNMPANIKCATKFAQNMPILFLQSFLRDDLRGKGFSGAITESRGMYRLYLTTALHADLFPRIREAVAKRFTVVNFEEGQTKTQLSLSVRFKSNPQLDQRIKSKGQCQN